MLISCCVTQSGKKITLSITGRYFFWLKVYIIYSLSFVKGYILHRYINEMNIIILSIPIGAAQTFILKFGIIKNFILY